MSPEELTSWERFVPMDPLEEWLRLKCHSEFDNHFHMCGLYADHLGSHRCCAKGDDTTWTDDEEDKLPFDPEL